MNIIKAAAHHSRIDELFSATTDYSMALVFHFVCGHDAFQTVKVSL